MIQNDIECRDYIKTIYSISSIGGPLHIVIDDYNIENEHVLWCIHNSIEKEQNILLKELCLQVANYLLKIPESRRFEIVCH